MLLRDSTAAACAIASTMSTPGITAMWGKWPGKKGSLAVTFFRATMRASFSKETTRSISRKGYRCGRYSLISSIFISLTVVSRVFLRHAPNDLVEVAQVRGVAQPFAVRHHRRARGVGARLHDGLGDEAVARDGDAVADREVADDAH